MDERTWGDFLRDFAWAVSVGVAVFAVIGVVFLVVARHELRFQPDDASSSVSIAPNP